MPLFNPIPLTVALGGTGSTTQNFVDLTTTQTIAGVKTFSSAASFSGKVGMGGAGNTTFALDITAATNDGIRITAANAAFLRLDTTAVGANNRNWLFIPNQTVAGDFAFRTSSAQGGDPSSAGTNRFYIDNLGNIKFTQAVLAGPNSNGATLTSPAMFAGTGAPSFSAPSGSLYIRYDGGANTRLYLNTSTASTSNTTWSAVTTP